MLVSNYNVRYYYNSFSLVDSVYVNINVVIDSDFFESHNIFEFCNHMLPNVKCRPGMTTVCEIVKECYQGLSILK